MSHPVISVRNIGKQYRLGATLGHDTLRDHIVHAVKSVGRALGGKKNTAPERSGPEHFWALKDISFDVQSGEVVGIIGRNGAGKSTLLKILSQITEPTTGEIHVRGRLASLLEVGTGFHQELSGRENIYLNGAILGMTKAEIRRKFDEIVAFAEVERFLDTPVKRYSSGMYVRLAFAVAAHLEPEILVVDEVLAVGDATFQSRCLGKMEDVARKQGRTVLFVSHNMAAVQALCTRAIHLQAGQVKGIGPVDEQIQNYLHEARENKNLNTKLPAQLGASLELRRFDFSPNPVISGDAVEFSLEIAANLDTRVGDLVILIYSMYGVRVAIIDLRQKTGKPYSLTPECPLRLSGQITSLPFVEGDYHMGIYVRCSEYYSDFYNLADLTVISRARDEVLVARAARHRGCYELDYSFAPEPAHDLQST